MAKGRPRKPDGLKQLGGTLQKCRTTEKIEPIQALAPLTDAKPPSWLSPTAKKIFKTKAAQLISIRVLTTLDVDLLAAYSAAYAQMIEAIKILEEKGIANTIYNDEGNITAFVVSPFEKIKNDAIKTVNQIGTQFGFTPASRAAILNSIPKEKEQDDFDEF